MAVEREVTYEIVEHMGIIGKDAKGWTKELNRVSWNGNAAKYDIRSWDEDHLKMGRGITFTKQEALELKNLLNQLEPGALGPDDDVNAVADEEAEKTA